LPETLLSTKIIIPPTRSELVPRPRLIAKLNEGLNHKLILISATAGFGKTTLVTDWLNKGRLKDKIDKQYHDRIAWLSLDAEDNDPARFLNYLIAAIQNVDPDLGKSAQVMTQSPYPPPPKVLLTSLINDIAATSPAFVLIIDDYHSIQNLAIHQQLGFLIEHQPTQMCLIILTREDPLLPLPQLRAAGEMVEIRQNDLRFSLEECGKFLQEVMGLNLSSSDVNALERRTEGWIAGLQLAALSVKESEDYQDYIRAFSGSNRFILDYLVEEVFTHQSAEVQDFLLKTSILNKLSAPLCETVSAVTNCQDLLLSLEQSNLFLIPLDQSRTWYRYHQLFADLLRHRLQNSGKHSESNEFAVTDERENSH